MPPARIGDYEILSRLGAGGMGTVYKARQVPLDRVVALKLLPSLKADDPEWIERLRREAQAVARLNHPHIVAGIDVGSANAFHYFAMEYVEGESLKDRIGRDGPLPEAEIARIGAAIASALAHAHAAGLIHRDVKPDNILLAADGTPKLADLGLVRRQETPEDLRLTQEGTTVGTPYYMSPEMVRGEREVDGRADAYSLGCTLYHAATGRTPFKATTKAEVLVMHLKDRMPHPRALRADLSEDFCAVLGKLTARDPKDRYSDLAEARADLEALAMGQTPSGARLHSTQFNFTPLASSERRITAARVRSKPVSQRRMWTTATWAGVMVFAAVILYVAFKRKDQGKTPAPVTETPNTVATTQVKTDAPPAKPPPSVPAPNPLPLKVENGEPLTPAPVLTNPPPSVPIALGSSSYRGTWKVLAGLEDGPGKSRVHNLRQFLYDSKRKRCVLYGGLAASAASNDLWAFEAKTGRWTCLLASDAKSPEVGVTRPPASFHGCFDYDARRDQYWLSSGWVFDPDAGTWRKFTATGKPPRICINDLGWALDSENRRFFGIHWASDGLYSWFLNTESFQTENLPRVTSVPHRSLVGGGLSYDPLRKVFILFGGWNTIKSEPCTDLWVCDPRKREWTEIQTPERPSGSKRPMLLWSGALKAFVCIGKAETDAGGTWVWVLDHPWRWVDSPTEGVQGLNASGAMVYDESVEQVILFGTDGCTYGLKVERAGKQF